MKRNMKYICWQAIPPGPLMALLLAPRLNSFARGVKREPLVSCQEHMRSIVNLMNKRERPGADCALWRVGGRTKVGIPRFAGATIVRHLLW